MRDEQCLECPESNCWCHFDKQHRKDRCNFGISWIGCFGGTTIITCCSILSTTPCQQQHQRLFHASNSDQFGHRVGCQHTNWSNFEKSKFTKAKCCCLGREQTESAFFNGSQHNNNNNNIIIVDSTFFCYVSF